jgi:CRP-like cAMP-binding protein
LTGKLIRLDAEDRARALANVPLFSGCDEAQLKAIAECAHLLSFDPAQTIVAEGEEGLGFYLLLSGSANVIREGALVAELGSGDFFGEIALIDHTPRTASVVATEPTICLGILRSDFRPLLIQQPRIAMRILEAEARRGEG